MSRYEITFDQYDDFAKATGRDLPDDEGWGRGRQPVIHVSWNDDVAYAKWLSQQTGKHYRLPTEAEWEYAARGGTETVYWWGNEVQQGSANCRGCGSRWDGKQPAPVGSFKSNQFGLYDTAGNVAERVQDCWHEDYEGAPTEGSAWEEKNGGDCGRRVVRGGSWFKAHDWARSSHRFSNRPTRSSRAGFRVVREIE
jgi:formylglycine-generating enzyme required for sulfatase activity